MAQQGGNDSAGGRASPFSLEGRVALVTGATKGLGLEIARACGRAGAQVAINGRDPARLRTAADGLREHGIEVEELPFDVGDLDAAEAGLGELATRKGRLDILVNNVGQRNRRPVDQLEPDDLRNLLDVNLVAPFALSKIAARVMATRKWGRIVNVTSIAGPIARPGDAAYTASKGGLEALTRALAAEFGPQGITVNGIAPGYFATEANAAMVNDAGTTEWLRTRSSLQRWGQPAEIAGAAVFLASEAASYVTGQVLVVDGGISARF